MSSNYEDKKKMLFDCLSSAEKCIQGTSLEQKDFARVEPTPRQSQPPIGRRFHGKESIFKRPEAPISKCLRPRRTPDYQANPHKWKKYSLDDADISDRTNTSAAFAFLAEIEKRKDAEGDNRDDDMDTNDGSSRKIMFKRQSNTREHRKPSFYQSAALKQKVEECGSSTESSEKAVLKGSKVIMPEYVIGQKVQKTKRKATTETSNESKKSDGKNKPHLQHLFDEDEEEEE